MTALSIIISGLIVLSLVVVNADVRDEIVDKFNNSNNDNTDNDLTRSRNSENIISTESSEQKDKNNVSIKINQKVTDNTNDQILGISTETFIYPNSTINSKNNTNLLLTSSNFPKDITDWYKRKINELNFNTKSFVSTNTNGNILNKLVATKDSTQVDVEITKDNQTDKTMIKINLK